MELKKRKLRGSFTVEAAMISGIWLLTIFASLLLILGGQQNITSTGTAYETAVREGTIAVSGESAVKEEKEIRISFENRIRVPFADLQWIQKGSAERKILRPAVFIENIKRTRKLKETLIR